MKKLFVLALSAMMVMSVSAQEAKKEFKGEKKAKMERQEFKGERKEFKEDVKFREFKAREGMKDERFERRPDFRPEGRPDFRPEGRPGCPEGGREFSKEEMLELKIKHLADELYLDPLCGQVPEQPHHLLHQRLL